MAQVNFITAWTDICRSTLLSISNCIMSLTGTIKKFIEEKGFGFIEKDDGSGDLFVHFSKLTSGSKEDMVEGAKVSFDEGWNDRTGKACAENVSIEGGGSGGGGSGGGGKGGGKSWAPY